ncbi:MAG: hypothetical protein ABIH04_01685 [Planctomycetota bacterium]
MIVPALSTAVSFPAFSPSGTLLELSPVGFWIATVLGAIAFIVVIVCGIYILLESRRKRSKKIHILSPGTSAKARQHQAAVRSKAFKEYFRPVQITGLEPHHLNIPKYDAFYLPRTAEEDKVVDLLNDGAYVVLSGKSGVGKSRTIFEILNRYNEFKGFTLLRPPGLLVEPLLSETYIPGNKYVLLLDGLERFSETTGAVTQMLEAVSSAAEQLFVFATVRKNSEDDPVYLEATSRPELWTDFKEIELTPFNEEEIAEIIDTCETGIKQNEFVDDTPLSALLSFDILNREYKALGDYDQPEGLRTILAAVKTLHMLGQPLDIVSLKKLSAVSLKQSQVLDEEIARLAESGFFEVVNMDVICHERVISEVLAGELPLEENALQMLVAEGAPVPLWWAGVELFKKEKYYKSLRCFEELENRHWTEDHTEHYLKVLRDKLNLTPPEEAEAPAAAPEAQEESAGEAEPAEKVTAEAGAAETPLEKAEQPAPEAAQIKEPIGPAAAETEEDDQPKRERRRDKIELQRDKETANYIENWRKEIAHQIEMRNYTGAMQNLHRLLATNYNDPETHLALGTVYAKISKPKRADYHLRKGVFMDKTNPKAHTKYACFLESLGKKTAALNEYFISGMLEVIKGDVRLEAFGKCNELSREVSNQYINYLAAAFYTCILYSLGERGDAIEFLEMLEAGYGQYPVVDFLIDTLRGNQPQPLQGDDLETHAAGRIAQLVVTEMDKARVPARK